MVSQWERSGQKKEQKCLTAGEEPRNTPPLPDVEILEGVGQEHQHAESALCGGTYKHGLGTPQTHSPAQLLPSLPQCLRQGV